MTNDAIIQKLKSFYQSIDSDSLDALRTIYDEQVVFEDPVHKIKGIEALVSYFAHGLANADECRFTIEDIVVNDTLIVLKWEMTLQHSKLNKGAKFNVPGMSFLKTTGQGEKIAYHRDYFDLGCMFYERLPFVRRVIHALKNRMKAV